MPQSTMPVQNSKRQEALQNNASNGFRAGYDAKTNGAAGREGRAFPKFPGKDIDIYLGAVKHLVRNTVSGTVVAALAFAYSLSFSLLLFSGPLAGSAPRGMAIVLLSTGLSTLIISVSSSFRIAVAGPDSAVIAVLAALVVGITSANASQMPNAELELLVLIALAGTTMFVGAMLLLSGVFRLGMWIRYVPFPVIAGFLVASGVLLVLGALRLVIGDSLSFVSLTDPMQAHATVPVTLAVGLAAILERFRVRLNRKWIP